MNFTRLNDRLKLIFLALAVLLVFSSSAEASLNFSISSSEANNQFNAGESVQFDVHVSGIELGQQLDSLSATISFDSAHFAPSLLIVGPILPDPLGSDSVFNGAAFTGLVDVFYQTTSDLSSQYITDNGLFFTLEVTVLTEGTGNIQFDFTDATEITIDDSFIPVASAGTEVSYVIVPEPPATRLFLLGTFLLGGALIRRSMKR